MNIYFWQIKKTFLNTQTGVMSTFITILLIEFIVAILRYRCIFPRYTLQCHQWLIEIIRTLFDNFSRYILGRVERMTPPRSSPYHQADLANLTTGCNLDASKCSTRTLYTPVYNNNLDRHVNRKWQELICRWSFRNQNCTLELKTQPSMFKINLRTFCRLRSALSERCHPKSSP